nr:hypothetical protein [Steroidobacter agaridevorans]
MRNIVEADMQGELSDRLSRFDQPIRSSAQSYSYQVLARRLVGERLEHSNEMIATEVCRRRHLLESVGFGIAELQIPHDLIYTSSRALVYFRPITNSTRCKCRSQKSDDRFRLIRRARGDSTNQAVYRKRCAAGRQHFRRKAFVVQAAVRGHFGNERGIHGDDGSVDSPGAMDPDPEILGSRSEDHCASARRNATASRGVVELTIDDSSDAVEGITSVDRPIGARSEKRLPCAIDWRARRKYRTVDFDAEHRKQFSRRAEVVRTTIQQATCSNIPQVRGSSNCDAQRPLA